MRWLIALALIVGGCSQPFQGIGPITGSIIPTIGGQDNSAEGQQPAKASPGPTVASAPATAAPAVGSPIVNAAMPGVGKAGTGKVGGAERISGNLFRVVADDRNVSDRIERENYTLLRAAETALAQGGTHFVLVSAGDQSTTGIPSLKALFSGDRDAEYGAYFRVLKLEPEGKAPFGAMSADEIVHFFGPRFGRTPT